MNSKSCTRALRRGGTLRIPVAALLIFVVSGQGVQGQQITVPRIELMPDMPSPYIMRDWRQVARGYDSLAFDLTRTGDYLPLVFLNSATVNYPGQTSFGLHSYVGDSRFEVGETINVIPAVVGATLCGIDKSNQNGRNWVLMCQEYFNNRPEENVYLNAPEASSGSDWWYDLMPNVFFYQLYDSYPGTGDFPLQFVTVADRWLEAVYRMGGSAGPWSHPSLEHRGWYLATMTSNKTEPHEPEGGGAMGWLLYNAFVVTGDRKYREGAEMCLGELSAYTRNPAYELQLSYGTVAAARMNAELGTSFDVAKMVNWCFEVSPIRSWGAMVGTWGGLDISGLIGEVNGTNDYPFLMNTFEQVGALLPLVRYDPRFARAVGKWVLNAANASRLLYSAYLPASNQDSHAWSSQYDPRSTVGYEALRQHGPGPVSPYATGDAIKGGWSPTNLSLYSSSHVGLLGAVLDTTNVQGILQLDLLKTDFFHAPAYPSFLLYNPHAETRTVDLDVGPSTLDIYEAVSKSFLSRGVSGAVPLGIPANSAVVVVFVPPGGTVTYDEERMKIDGVVVDYHSGVAVPNHRPRIKGVGPAPRTPLIGTTARLFCTATDSDGDTLQYEWSASAGSLQGEGSIVSWTVPPAVGSYRVTCRVTDNGGGSDSADVEVSVVDVPVVPPVITSVLARPSKVDLGGTTTVLCRAFDPGGGNLTYRWHAAQGTVVGSDSTVQWTAPAAPGNYAVVCSVDNGQGIFVADSAVVPVRDFSAGGVGDLVLSMPFAGNAHDVSGFGNHGTSQGLAPAADRFGTPAHAYSFNGTTSNIRVPNSASLSIDTAITVSLWIKPGTMPLREMFPISHGSWQNRWKISITPERAIRWTIRTTAGVTDVDSRTPVVTGVDYFVAGTFDGQYMELYVNGELEALTAWSGSLLTPAIDLMVGQMLPTDANYNFPGVVDDIRIYSYALTYPQVRSLFQVTTGANGYEEAALPEFPRLVGNFPNPFNPATEIVVHMPESGIVTLRIYDLLGTEVATLLNDRLGPGRHTIRFDAAGRASGVYVCRFTSGGRMEAKKLLLLR